MGYEVATVKAKITSLLSSFRREKSKMKKSMGTGKGRDDIYISSWFAFKFFDFLSEKDTPKDNVNTQYTSDEEESQDKSSQSALHDTNESNEGHCAEQSSQDNTQSDSQRNEPTASIKGKVFRSPKNIKQKQKKKEKDDPRLTRAYEILDSVSSVPAPRDACSVYAEHVGNMLRKFNEQRRAIFMHKFNNLIFEAEMELYNSQQDLARQNNSYNNMYSSSDTSSFICTPEGSPNPVQSTSQQVSFQEQLSAYNPHEPSSSQFTPLQNFVKHFNV